MKIFVRLHSQTGQMLTIEVSKDDTVDNLKYAINERAGIAVDTMILIYKGARLDDVKTLAMCGIKDECTVIMIQRTTEKIQICVKDYTGKTTIVYVRQNDTVKNLKYALFLKVGVTVDKISLNNGVKHMENDLPLTEYGLQESSNIFWSERLPGGM